MSNLEIMQNIISCYFADYGVDTGMNVTTLHDASRNDSDPGNEYYVYDGKDLNVIDMDRIAAKGYKEARKAEGQNNIVNTVDGFLIDQTDQWFFIEFKDEELVSKKDKLKHNLIQKAYGNWYMMLDILYHQSEKGQVYPGFTYNQPTEFAREHIQYILVCSLRKNPVVYSKIRDCRLMGKKYTPPFLQRLKDYLFQDVYAYTEEDFEREFVKKFCY